MGVSRATIRGATGALQLCQPAGSPGAMVSTCERVKASIIHPYCTRQPFRPPHHGTLANASDKAGPGPSVACNLAAGATLQRAFSQKCRTLVPPITDSSHHLIPFIIRSITAASRGQRRNDDGSVQGLHLQNNIHYHIHSVFISQMYGSVTMEKKENSEFVLKRYSN